MQPPGVGVWYGSPAQLAPEGIWSMFRQITRIALVVMVAFGSLTVAIANEPIADGRTEIPPKELSVDLGKSVTLAMVLIPAGEFMMGSPDSDKNARDEEKPQHRVRITRPFYLGKYLVTQGQWEVLMGNNPSRFKGPKNPVERVSFDDCQAFVGKLNAKTRGQRGKFALPTEAQWEYACRAGSRARYCFGDDERQLGEYGWIDTNSSGKTHAVGEKRPNDWGLYDMHGNVWEWCQDYYDAGFYAKSPPDDPTATKLGSFRMIRGGGWYYGARNCGSANRFLSGPEYRYEVLGLRVCQLLVNK
jgi:formylglycine-generating enzyme required for sulfatase activity